MLVQPTPPYYGDTQDLRYSSADQLASTLRESFVSAPCSGPASTRILTVFLACCRFPRCHSVRQPRGGHDLSPAVAQPAQCTPHGHTKHAHNRLLLDITKVANHPHCTFSHVPTIALALETILSTPVATRYTRNDGAPFRSSSILAPSAETDPKRFDFLLRLWFPARYTTGFHRVPSTAD
jgi:hypothetical protein